MHLQQQMAREEMVQISAVVYFLTESRSFLFFCFPLTSLYKNLFFFQACNKSLINQACSELPCENIGPGPFFTDLAALGPYCQDLGLIFPRTRTSSRNDVIAPKYTRKNNQVSEHSIPALPVFGTERNCP